MAESNEMSLSPAEAEAKRKLETWLAWMEPMDYDALGMTARETGA